MLRVNTIENGQGELRDHIIRFDGQTKKIGLLWINFLDSKNLISPILSRYGNTYADSIGATNSNKTKAVREEIERLDVNETAEYKRIVTDRLPSSFSVKLTPIDENEKKVNMVTQGCFRQC